MTRRPALLVIAACCLAVMVVGPARAQDPRATIAQKEARSWLALTDRGDAVASWNTAGKQFQNAMTADKWAEAQRQVRPQLGALVERTLLGTQFNKTFPGAPDSDYAMLVFRTKFANKTDSRETVTLEHETDGTWRVVGYFIH